jgi:erythromycin esterase
MSRGITLGWLLATCLCAGQLPDRHTRIEWLANNATFIRSIDPTNADDDFADLLPLMRAVGDSRLVILGEESHGDGATFLAKGRIIKFLHRKLGFDVLAWEAGLFNCSDMNAGLSDPAIPLELVMQRGLYPIWSRSAQVRPVFEYARSAARTASPLEMIGFDHQFSGLGGFRWRDTMIAFIDKADPAILPKALRDSLMDGANAVFHGQTAKPNEIRAVAKTWSALPGVLDQARTKLVAAHGSRYADLMRRSADDALISLEGLARFRESGGAFKAGDNNLRDRRMAKNLIWLANERYKGRRLIVWAAAFHALHEPSAITLGPESGFSYQDVITMGQIARKVFGLQMCTIAFTAAEGRAGNEMGGQNIELHTPKDGSFEDLCLQAGRPFLFVDMRTLPGPNWLNREFVARPLGYSPINAAWARQFDALVFIRTMFPSTSGQLAPDEAALSADPIGIRQQRK